MAKTEDIILRGSSVVRKQPGAELRLTIMADTKAIAYTGGEADNIEALPGQTNWWRRTCWTLCVLLLAMTVWTSTMWWKGQQAI